MRHRSFLLSRRGTLTRTAPRTTPRSTTAAEYSQEMSPRRPTEYATNGESAVTSQQLLSSGGYDTPDRGSPTQPGLGAPYPVDLLAQQTECVLLRFFSFSFFVSFLLIFLRSSQDCWLTLPSYAARFIWDFCAGLFDQHFSLSCFFQFIFSSLRTKYSRFIILCPRFVLIIQINATAVYCTILQLHQCSIVFLS